MKEETKQRPLWAELVAALIVVLVVSVVARFGWELAGRILA